MDVTAYLTRIGAAADDPLEDLMRRHLEAVPFENLSVHLPEPIHLDVDELVVKIVDRHRGGFCYELNGAFGGLLGALGYDVALCSARVARNGGDDGFGPPGDHMALLVGREGRRLLVDVGFGRFAVGPLDVDRRDDQPDHAGTYAVHDAPDGDLDVLADGTIVYRLDPRPRILPDFAPPAWWHATSPESPFALSVTCSRLTPTGRVTISDDRLIETGDDGSRAERTLTVDEQLATYRDVFGVELDAVPTVAHPS
ncbi:arylamine N-acetyltransferase family protein [Actinomycetospora cinnamomea]|nr:arylamine N-acetyltransferase [Actinomycetospora cinnamomea]